MPAGPYGYTLLDPALISNATGFHTVGVGQVNDAGQVLGTESGSPGGTRPFLYSDGGFTDLDVPGAASTIATGLSDTGEVIGRYADGAGGSHSFAYADGAFTEIAAPGAASTAALQITRSGLILAEYFDSAGLHPAIDDNGAFTTLAVPGASSTAVRTTTAPAGGGTLPVLNDAGQVVGSYADDAGTHAFLYSDGSYATLAVPGASSTTATTINAAGQVLGTYTTAGNTGTRGFLYSDGAYSTIAVPGSTNTTASQLNDAGQVAGTYTDSAGSHVFLDTDGNTITVNPPLGGSASFVQLSNAGDVLANGNNGASGSQPFIYSGGVSTGAGVPGAASTSATRFNDLGQLIGTFFDGVSTRAFLATPAGGGTVPEAAAGDPAGTDAGAAALLLPVDDGGGASMPAIGVADPGLLLA